MAALADLGAKGPYIEVQIVSEIERTGASAKQKLVVDHANHASKTKP